MADRQKVSQVIAEVAAQNIGTQKVSQVIAEVAYTISEGPPDAPGLFFAHG